MSEDQKARLQESGLINWAIFSELTEMDEDEEGFSKGLITTFIQQALEIFSEIKENIAMSPPDLIKLSSLGHYLKGSAAALGLQKIQAECERIQNYGNKNNFDNFGIAEITEHDTSAITEDSDQFWLLLIEDALNNARIFFQETKLALNDYFNDEF